MAVNEQLRCRLQPAAALKTAACRRAPTTLTGYPGGLGLRPPSPVVCCCSGFAAKGLNSHSRTSLFPWPLRAECLTMPHLIHAIVAIISSLTFATAALLLVSCRRACSKRVQCSCLAPERSGSDSHKCVLREVFGHGIDVWQLRSIHLCRALSVRAASPCVGATSPPDPCDARQVLKVSAPKPCPSCAGSHFSSLPFIPAYGSILLNLCLSTRR